MGDGPSIRHAVRGKSTPRSPSVPDVCCADETARHLDPDLKDARFYSRFLLFRHATCELSDQCAVRTGEGRWQRSLAGRLGFARSYLDLHSRRDLEWLPIKLPIYSIVTIGWSCIFKMLIRCNLILSVLLMWCGVILLVL